MIYRDCRYHLRYANRDFCRYVWQADIMADPKELQLGCDVDCQHKELVEWRRDSEGLTRPSADLTSRGRS